MAKVVKTEVNYSRGMLHSHCGPIFVDDRHYCRHFIPPGGIGGCEKVEGPIYAQCWCELFKQIDKA